MPAEVGIKGFAKSLASQIYSFSKRRPPVRNGFRPIPRQRRRGLSTSTLSLRSESHANTSTRESLQPYYQQEQISALLSVEDDISRTPPRKWKPRRRDAFNLPYFTDLSRVDPFLDSAPSGIPKSGRWPGQPVPQMEGVQFEQGEEEDENKIKDLSRLTGLQIPYLETLKIRELVSHRVTNQTRLGKIAKQYVLTVAGDGNGMIGIGEASSTTMELASRLSQYQAIKNLRPIIRYEDRTIYGNVKVKMGAVEVLLMSRPPGFGVRCSQYIFEICRCAGISDLAARVTRSRNPMNVIKATVQALTVQKTPGKPASAPPLPGTGMVDCIPSRNLLIIRVSEDTIARGRGKKVVDVRKAYYGRGVY